MTWVALLRHGRTAWNAAGRIQGRRDVLLPAETCAALARRAVPAELAGGRWYTSPLSRARETARLLGAAAPILEERLVEMDWGSWEGCTLAELRQGGGPDMAANENRGLDFRPHGGESPREVQARAADWLREVAAAGGPALAVTHKGVIRAVLALACDWDLTGPPPAKLDWSCFQRFELGPDGTPRPAGLNLPLAST